MHARYVFSVLVLAASSCLAQEREPGADANLLRIPLPKLNVIEGREDVAIETIEEWMSNFELATLSRDFEFHASVDLSGVRRLKGDREHVKLERMNLRLGESRGDSRQRVVISRQNLLDNQSIAEEKGRAVDSVKSIDYLQMNGKAHVTIGTGASAMPGDDGPAVYIGKPEEWKKLLQRSGVFHPFRATVTHISQTMSGYSQEVSNHSVIRKTIRGVSTIGQYTHVLLNIGDEPRTIRQIVTFLDECPVQLARWDKVDPKTGEPLVYEILRSQWTEYAKGIKVPVRIVATRQDKTRPSEFEANIEWRFDNDVSKEMFRVDTLGKIAVTFDAQDDAENLSR